MMFWLQIEPVLDWGFKPCEDYLLSSINTFVTAGVVTRRTHPGLGAASSRSNIAEQFSFSYGRHIRREREFTNGTKEGTSSAMSCLPKAPTSLVVYSHRLIRAHSGFLSSFIRWGISATSKIATFYIRIL